MLEYSVSWLCDSLVGGSLCSWGAKFPTVTYLPRATATARHRVTDNFHVVELFTLLSSLYREPVTFFCLFLEGIPYLHLFFFLTDHPENFLDLSLMELQRQFSWIWPTQKNQLTAFSGSQLLILGHMSLLIVSMMFKSPWGLNFPQVNPLLQQLQERVRESDL